jgi:hypothetical protein
MALGQLRGAAAPSMAVMEQSRMLAHTLSNDTNPKFQVLLMLFTQNNFKLIGRVLLDNFLSCNWSISHHTSDRCLCEGQTLI